MALIKEVTVLTQHTLRLDVDAKKDDVIDLLKLNQVDTSILEEKIISAKDELYKKKIAEVENRLRIESENQVFAATEEYKKTISELIAQIKTQQTAIEATLRASFEKEKTEHSLRIQELQSQIIANEAKYQSQITALEKDNKIALQAESEVLKTQISILQDELKRKDAEVRLALSANHEKSLGELRAKIAILEAEKKAYDGKASLEKEAAVAEKERVLTQQIYELKNTIGGFELEKEKAKSEVKEQLSEKISQLEQDLASHVQTLKLLNENKETEIQLAVSLKSQELTDTLASKDQQIAALQMTRSLLNIKKQGEKLESWCNLEYESYAQNGFETCTWEKDNTAVKDEDETKGSKADYLFKVYASNAYLSNELLTSVVCEMKTEDPASVHKNKNAVYLDKLEKDRKKKKCEYAILISELEWDQENDLPIRKALNHDKMYIVRPTYFIAFLSVVASLGLKYKDILVEHKREEEEFKETKTIFDEFDKLKTDIIDKNLVKIQKQIEVLRANSEKMRVLASDNDEAINSIYKEAIEQIKKKIENFNIKKITKKIEKLDTQS